MMCKWGTYEEVIVPIPPDLSCDGEFHMAMKKIDACIAPIVKALNQGGVYTRSCCCGHGERDGHIDLWDGRILVVKSKEDADKWLSEY